MPCTGRFKWGAATADFHAGGGREPAARARRSGTPPHCRKYQESNK